jgi:Rieske Fe-S protein
MPSNIPNSSRRNFFGQLGSALAGVVIVGSVAPILDGCSSPTGPSGNDLSPGADAGKSLTVNVAALTSDNTAVHAKAPATSRDLLVVRRTSTTYETILLTCTHTGCTYPDIDIAGSQIVCGCHNSKFDLDGKVTQPPATVNLTTFATTYDSGAKTVTVKF